jgi:hypothetical protein
VFRLTLRAISIGIVLLSASCGSDKTKSQADCDAISNEIRTTATQRGLDPNGVCSSTSPTVQADFQKACAALDDCHAHCCK